MARLTEREPSKKNIEVTGHFHQGQSRVEAIQNLLRESLFKKGIDSLKEILRPHFFGIRCIGDGCPPTLSARMAV